ncbi:BppU family phage baseplate upper protein [Lactobacillus johnsonii]|nr:BppU family phage baseplate upper protein [Lactobacillus johnsonii]
MKNITIRDSGNNEVLEAYFLNHEGQPYNLENKTVTFMENKDGDKFVSDPNVQIVNATAGFVRYTLQSQVHSAPGIAWFEINDSSGLVDSTANFNIRVEDGLRATADNTTYIDALEKLKRQMEALIQQADGELKAELQRAEQQLNQELQDFRNQYNSLSADFQNQFKTAQDARQQDYNNQKNAINQDWTNNKNSIWEQWNNDKANIDRQAQDTIQTIKDNAKQVLDKDQADWNAKQTQWDSTFSAIVKEWQVKTNSLNATVQDLTNKFNTIIGQVSDLMNNKIPTMNAKTDAIQAKVNELRASLSQIDWTTFARRTDNSGGVNLLPNTSTFKLFGTGHYGDSDAHNGISIEPKNQHSSETNINLVKTKIAHVWGDKAKNAPLNIPGGVYLPAGTYTLSFLARTNGRDDSPVFHFGLYSDWTNNHGGAPLATSDAINNKWGRHQITFSIPESYYHITLRIQQYNDDYIPGGSLYFANLKLEAGSIATDWCQSYLDFDRLDGRHDPVDAPDFNNLTSTGIYLITQPDHGQNYPTGDGGTLKVENSYDSRIEQTFYAEDVSGSVYRRQCVDKTWRDWKKVASIDDVNTRLPLAGGNMAKGSWITWSGSNANSANDGNIGGLQWNGATDNIQIYGNNNRADNLDLVIKLGDDNSNRISFRDKDGAERAAITADGQFTGQTNWANVMNTGINNPTLFRRVTNSNTWNDIIGQDNGLAALAAFRDDSDGSGATIGKNSAGIVFGGGDTKGVLNVDWNPGRASARIIGGNGNGPVWHKDIAWKDDLKINVIRNYDVKTKTSGNPTSESLGVQWLVDQAALRSLAENINSLKGQGTYRHDEVVDVNTFTGQANQVTTYILTNSGNQNAPVSMVNPSMSDPRGTLIVFNYDGNAKTQLWIPVGTSGRDMGFAWRYWEGDNAPGWNIFYDAITSIRSSVDAVRNEMNAQNMAQSKVNKRVDYEDPSGTISNQTVNLNNYRETGILKVVNCLIQNGPYTSDNRHTLFLKITNLDGQTQYQTIYEGDNLYGRKLYNGSGQWHKYTNTPI